jgi:hypothetical protein
MAVAGNLASLNACSFATVALGPQFPGLNV